MLKIQLFFILLLTGFVYGGVQELQIGKIDTFYANKLTHTQLKKILLEIEQQLESQLGYDVFNYTQNGKPIYIKYVPPLELEKNIERKIAQSQKKKKEIEKLQTLLPSLRKGVQKHQESLTKFTNYINNKTEELNIYVRGINKKKHLTSEEYKQAQVYVESRQKRINREKNTLRQDKRSFSKKLRAYNKKVAQLNKNIRAYNRLQNQLERMNRNFTQVKGKAFGLTETTLKTYYKDGKKIKEKSTKSTMTKIEIYGFESRDQLKAVLAHEIGHFVGIPHINSKNALMNPYLQKNQIEKLYLTQEDIRNFNKHF